MVVIFLFLGHDSMAWHNNKKFSTRDRDNDGWNLIDCAERHRGAWWFEKLGYNPLSNKCSSSGYCEQFSLNPTGCAECGESHLNADYDSSTRGKNIFWDDLNSGDCNLRYTSMSIRPTS